MNNYIPNLKENFRHLQCPSCKEWHTMRECTVWMNSLKDYRKVFKCPACYEAVSEDLDVISGVIALIDDPTDRDSKG